MALDLGALLQAAQEPKDKKQRGRGDSAEGENGGEDVSTLALTRDVGFLSLHTAKTARVAFNNRSLACILKEDEAKDAMGAIKELWHTQLPPQEKGKPRRILRQRIRTQWQPDRQGRE